MSDFIVAALYKFVKLPHFQALQSTLQKFCDDHHICGSLLLASEGINGTIAGSRQNVDTLLNFLRSMPEFHDIEHKEATASKKPFLRMKVKLKKEIVTMGVPGVDPTSQVGTYLNSQEWNELLKDPNLILIDTRNDYEVAIGKFHNAIDPNIKTFRDFPKFIQDNYNPTDHPRVAMYCTGGIRCEKSTSYLLSLGYKEVYHLKGGILKYLEEIPADQSCWEGECFVFDERTAVKHNVQEGSYELCHGCRYPITEDDKRSHLYEPGVCCPHCKPSLSPKKYQRASQRQRQIDLAKKRGQAHIGPQSYSAKNKEHSPQHSSH